MGIFPYYKVPKPTGDFKVGTETMDIIDKNRIEEYNNLNENREIRLQVWYPIDTDKGLKKAKWLYDGKNIARGLSKDSNLPYFTFDKLSKIYSNSYIGGNLSSSEEKYPVVIISHGWRSVRNLYNDYAEELASHGYVVFAIDHTYGSVATELEDRGLVEVNYNALPDSHEDDFFEKSNTLVNTFADDIATSIDYIENLNNNDNMFKNRININEIGLMGHSTGGESDIRLAINDSRIKSVVGLDPWVAPIKKEVIEKGLNIPSLIYRSKQWEKAPNNENLEILYKNSKIKPLIYQVNGTTHYDFAMLYMYSYITKKLGYSGSIDNKKLTEMLRNNINTFFNETLKENKKSNVVVKQYKDMQEVIF